MGTNEHFNDWFETKPFQRWTRQRDFARYLVGVAFSKEPYLTPSGLFDEAPCKKEQEQLFSCLYLEQVYTSYVWISCQRKLKSFNRYYNSYQYKHLVERWGRQTGLAGYVANGAFIAAAIGSGFPYERSKNTANVYLPISPCRA